MVKRSHIVLSLWFPVLFIVVLCCFHDRIDRYSQEDIVALCRAHVGPEELPILFEGCLNYSGAFYTGSFVEISGAEANRGRRRPGRLESLLVVRRDTPPYVKYIRDDLFRLLADKNGYAVFIALTEDSSGAERGASWEAPPGEDGETVQASE